MRTFADLVMINKQLASVIRTDQPFMKWSTFKSIKVKQVRLERVFVYQIRNTGFLVEASHVMIGGLGCCWSIDVHHSEWPMHLAQLEKLAPGRAAATQPSLIRLEKTILHRARAYGSL